MLKLFVTRLMLRKTSKKGQSLAEYGLILALVAVFCIAALQLLGNNITTMMNKVAGSIGNVASSTN